MTPQPFRRMLVSIFRSHRQTPTGTMICINFIYSQQRHVPTVVWREVQHTPHTLISPRLSLTTYLTLSGAHFSVKLILAINGNLGVFGVTDHDSGIRFAKLKMADP